MHQIKATEIEGVEFLEAVNSNDSRGQFIKFHPNELLEDLLSSVALSINPKAGTIRGIHLQIQPFTEEKIISCIKGSTFEVLIDIRPDSRSFGKIATFELSQEDTNCVYLPKGIAHGFQTLLPETIVHYVLTSKHVPNYSLSIDPLGLLGIDWPIKELLISEKDKAGFTLAFAAEKYAESLKS